MFNSYEEVEKYMKQRDVIGIKPGLERMNKLLTRVGNPEQEITAIHVAGTNGKGSTIHYMSEAFRSHGYQVGIFTSPSMYGLRGHILHNGLPISKKNILSIMNELYPYIQQLDQEEMAPTPFEILTVIAFRYFAKYVDLSLIETGMGGREDTTNCITPILSIITSVAKDHQAFLGNTIEQIASHKAGIIKPMIPVILGELEESAYQVILEEAKKKQAKVYRFGFDFTCDNKRQEGTRQHFQWKTKTIEMPICLQMSGEHQVKNASMALMALFIFHQKYYPLNKKYIQNALTHTQIPGRFEKVSEQPHIIIDGAHNQAGIDAFIQTVNEQYKNKKKQLVFAGFKDKDLKEMLTKCIPFFESVYITTFEHPRAIGASQLQKEIGASSLYVKEDWQELLRGLITSSSSKEESIFIVGSFHFITIVRRYFLGE